MKKRHIVIQFFILLIVIAVIAAWTSIRTNQINAKTYQGTIQLSGYVNSNKAVDKAAEIVKSVKGVIGIKNNLIVKQGKEKYHEVEHQG